MLQHVQTVDAFTIPDFTAASPVGSYVPPADLLAAGRTESAWHWVTDPETVWPSAPATVEEVGVSPSLLEDLIIKHLHFNSPSTAEALCKLVGLSFSVVDALLYDLKTENFVEVTSADRLGELNYRYRLTGKGDTRADESLVRSRYANVAPAPLEQYIEVVKKQSLRHTPPSPGKIMEALSGFVLQPNTLDQLARALHSGRTSLIFGASGNGKTAVLESYAAHSDDSIIIPFALYVHGQVIRIYDAAVHQRQDHPDDDLDDPTSLFKSSVRTSHLDQRWLRVRRPVIIVGGELTHESLERSFDPLARFYQAPPHLEAQDGVFVVDDFGRQRIRPEELLNRWIAPMKRGFDMMALNTGETFSVPFEIALMFSTNLHPAELVDEAFLRRIPYKVLLPNPQPEAFKEIALRVCAARRIAYTEETLDYLTRRVFAPDFGYDPKSVYPRDIVAIILDICRFDGAKPSLTPDAVERAIQVYFII